MKKILLPLALVASIAPAVAGGYLTNTNQHIAFLRNPARNASTEIDALYSNPAGAAFLPQGWHFSLNLQSAYQNRDLRANFAPFAANADGKSCQTGERLFPGRAKAPVLPSAFWAYKRGQWTVGGHFGVAGGGGRALFAQGLPSFEAKVAVLPSALNGVAQSAGAPIPQATQYKYDSRLSGGQFIFAGTVGTAYRINKNWSVYAGVRANFAQNMYEGYLRNIEVNLGGNMVALSPFLAQQAEKAKAGSAQAAAAGQAERAKQLGRLGAIAEQYAAATADKEVDVCQSGFGLTPIIGVNYSVGDFHFAAKYEFQTKITVENVTSKNDFDLPAYNDKVKSGNDMPALLSLGMSYKVLPDLKLSAGYTHYFDKDARMAGDKQKALKGGTHEWQAGAEYDLNERLMLSAGVQITNYGQSANFQSDLSFHNDSYSVGMGLRYLLTKNIKLNVAYLFSQYEKFGKQENVVVSQNPLKALPLQTTYLRTNHVFGVGADFSF